MKEIVAANFADPAGDPAQSAHNCARAVKAAWEEDEQVLLNIDGLHGASSSYFNLLFVELLRDSDASLVKRIELQSSSKVLQGVAQRSKDAVLRRHSASVA